MPQENTPTPSATPPAAPGTSNPAPPPAPPQPPQNAPGAPQTPHNSFTPPPRTPTLEIDPGAYQQQSQELADAKRRLRELEAAEETRRQSELSELEKAQERATQAEARAAQFERQSTERHALEAAWEKAQQEGADPARRAGFLAVVKPGDITQAPDGSFVGVDVAVTKVKTMFPEIFGAAPIKNTADPNTGGPKSGAQNPPPGQGGQSATNVFDRLAAKRNQRRL